MIQLATDWQKLKYKPLCGRLEASLRCRVSTWHIYSASGGKTGFNAIVGTRRPSGEIFFIIIESM